MTTDTERRKMCLSLRIPFPDSTYGYTWNLLETKVFKNDKEMEWFKDWMIGQTMGIDETTNEPIVYENDVWRGLNYYRNSVPTYWD